MNRSNILAHGDYAAGATFTADVVVIGTGAGGAAAGAELAEMGHDVLFVEEGGYHPTTSFNPYTVALASRYSRGMLSTV